MRWLPCFVNETRKRKKKKVESRPNIRCEMIPQETRQRNPLLAGKCRRNVNFHLNAKQNETTFQETIIGVSAVSNRHGRSVGNSEFQLEIAHESADFHQKRSNLANNLSSSIR